MRMSRRLGLYSNIKKKVRYLNTLSAGSYRSYLAAADVDDKYVLFAGGYINASSASAAVYACDELLTVSQIGDLQVGRYYMCSASDGKRVLFLAGKVSGGTDCHYADMYDEVLTHSILPSLTVCKGGSCAAAVAGANVVVVGGYTSGEYYNDELSICALPSTFDAKMTSASATNAGSNAIFAGGTYNTSAIAFNASLTKTVLTEPSAVSPAEPSTEHGTYAVFSWGRTYLTDLYESSTLSKSTAPALSTSRRMHAIASAGEFLVAACGCPNSSASGGTNVVDVYDDKFVRTSPFKFPYNMGRLHAGSIGNTAIFCGDVSGTTLGTTPLCVVKFS